MVKIPSIPSPVPHLDALYSSVLALKQTVEIITGQTNDEGSSHIEWGEITELKEALGLRSSANVISNSRTPGNALSLTSTTAANICSITLTPGTWMLFASAVFVGNGSTQVFHNRACITTQSATFVSNYGDTNSISNVHNSATIYSSGTDADTIGPYIVTVTQATTMYLVVSSSFTVSTNTSYGSLHALQVM